MPRVTRTERSPLDWLRERRDKAGNPMISSEEYSAGERLRADFQRAQMQPHVTASYSGLPVERLRRGSAGEGLELFEAVADARQRVRDALAAVGTDHANVLLDVCCLESGLGEVEREAGWPQRSGKIILQMALRQLARHYGLLRPDWDAREKRPFIRQWSAEGYRGTLENWSDDADGGRRDGHGADA